MVDEGVMTSSIVALVPFQWLQDTKAHITSWFFDNFLSPLRHMTKNTLRLKSKYVSKIIFWFCSFVCFFLLLLFLFLFEPCNLFALIFLLKLMICFQIPTDFHWTTWKLFTGCFSHLSCWDNTPAPLLAASVKTSTLVYTKMLFPIMSLKVTCLKTWQWIKLSIVTWCARNIVAVCQWTTYTTNRKTTVNWTTPIKRWNQQHWNTKLEQVIMIWS